MIQTNSWAEAVFRTTVRRSATFKEELSAPKETLIIAGWCNIPLCAVGSAWLVMPVSAKATTNCMAQMGALNTTETL